MDTSLPLSGPHVHRVLPQLTSEVPSCPEAPQVSTCRSMRNLHRQSSRPLPCPGTAECYHDEAAVKVEALCASRRRSEGEDGDCAAGRQGASASGRRCGKGARLRGTRPGGLRRAPPKSEPRDLPPHPPTLVTDQVSGASWQVGRLPLTPGNREVKRLAHSHTVR